MPAVSKAQQRFMGMVYATKKGDMTNPSPEVAQAAASMKKSDAKDFASTKHKKLPEKKVAKEETLHEDEYRKMLAKERKTEKERESKRGGVRSITPGKHADSIAKDYAEKQKQSINYMDRKTKNNKVIVGMAKEAYYGGEEQRKKDEKKKKIDAFMDKAMPKRTFDQMGRETDRRTGKLKEEDNFSQKDQILKKAKPLHKHLYNRLHKKDTSGDVNEKIDYADSKQMKRFADEKKKHKEQDRRMKFGKFSKRAEEARDRLRPGEVKRYDKAKGKWVSNKD